MRAASARPIPVVDTYAVVGVRRLWASSIGRPRAVRGSFFVRRTLEYSNYRASGELLEFLLGPDVTADGY